MPDVPLQRVKKIFAEAADLTGAARSTYLDQSCGEDEQLRSRVEALLAQHDLGGGLFDPGDESGWVLTRSRPLRAFAAGQVLDRRFRVVRYVGRGGMGEVYEAEDLELGGRVALKTLRPEIVRDDRHIARFKREVQIARNVTHPNVCRVFDVGRHRRDDGFEVAFLTMEFLDGETLAEYLERNGPLISEKALPLIRQMAEGLQALHDKSIVHRDFKPGNVMLASATDGGKRAVLMDFGVARNLAAATGSLTAGSVAGQVLGTPEYMAPEQFSGGPIGPWTDVYALGLVVRTMVAPDLATSRPWGPTVERCLRLNPSERPAGPMAVIDALEGEASQPIESLTAPARLLLKRRAVITGAAAAAATMVFVAGREWTAMGPAPFHTSSPSAGADYTTAEEFARAGDFEQAIRRLREATRKDPDFALAHMLLGTTLVTVGAYEEGLASGRRALAIVDDRADYPVWDAYRVRGRYAILVRDYGAALESYATLAAFAEDRGGWLSRSAYDSISAEAYRSSALIYSYLGRAQPAIDRIKKAQGKDPSNYRNEVLEATFSVEAGDPDRALILADRAQAQGGGDPYPRWAEGLAYLYLGRIDAACRSFELLESRQESSGSGAGDRSIYASFARIFRVQAMIHDGRWCEAIEQLRADIDADALLGNSEHGPMRTLWLAELVVAIGGSAELWLDEVLRLPAFPQYAIAFRDGAVRAADLSDAQLMRDFALKIEEVNQRYPSRFIRALLNNVLGDEARLAGDWKKAEILLTSAGRYLRDARVRWSLALLWEANERFDKAIDELKGLLAIKGWILSRDSCLVWVRTHLMLARMARRAGRVSEASTYYRSFLDLMTGPDGLPAVASLAAEVRHEMGALPF